MHLGILVLMVSGVAFTKLAAAGGGFTVAPLDGTCSNLIQIHHER